MSSIFKIPHLRKKNPQAQNPHKTIQDLIKTEDQFYSLVYKTKFSTTTLTRCYNFQKIENETKPFFSRYIRPYHTGYNTFLILLFLVWPRIDFPFRKILNKINKMLGLLSFAGNDKYIEHPQLGAVSCTGLKTAFNKCNDLLSSKGAMPIQCRGLYDISKIFF